MPSSPAPAPPGLSRRALLAASAGLALLAVGCTPGSSGGSAASEQADRLAGQVAVQESLVAAYAAAAAADAVLGSEVAGLAAQAGDQLDRLRAAAPSPGPSPVRPSLSAGAPPAGSDVRAWLRGQVTAAADAHAGASTGQTGARAALLGSVAAGLRGHAAALA
ncbi:hypothetical protein DQ238_05920 [Geodermatophilus sp. TF02-6]|uniref:hypothetical protein n=1 Tax=Geodermatophilus sp. TF02-6 TaxID=2250575 RepID=UPI000DE9E06A|nr:hypothetical protein [Geodermatophilus sp. TF02-6]RBY82126.1 hypothetical protein DQ238_05920 [Geodermatophilus sp. TF02-6]